MASFAEQLHLARGLTAIIGGGGKTSLLYRLAEELAAQGSVIVATSTHIWPPEHLPVLERTQAVRGVACVGSRCENGKLGAPAQSFSELAGLADFVLVEADGSAGRPLKAHLPHEPVIPENAAQVIAVVGLSGMGRPICEAAHRPEVFARLAGAAVTNPAAPEHAARVLTAEALHTRVLLNQADTPERIAAGERLAGGLSCPAVLASLQKGEILCSY